MFSFFLVLKSFWQSKKSQGLSFTHWEQWTDFPKGFFLQFNTKEALSYNQGQPWGEMEGQTTLQSCELIIHETFIWTQDDLLTEMQECRAQLWVRSRMKCLPRPLPTLITCDSVAECHARLWTLLFTPDTCVNITYLCNFEKFRHSCHPS